ncbi:hypothetical protein MKK64_14360 [Methylobacterium sp. E-025]|uniref:hypothetical protein n=1 Tax=unclassified Methylobacterium TaxID=2615210 RepID=UPI001FB905EA|nr:MULTISPECIES: hypothetical protein [unclassified Methylobacterium]MCJ2008202.1 hypothetical protein [Methylobacterium sp. J-092]MCJ2112368.1 hypothetical protein [Methylobacterium sp. E-025]
MTSNTVAIVCGAGCALIGPAVARAFTNDPTDQLTLSLIIAGSVVVTVLVCGLRSWED